MKKIYNKLVKTLGIYGILLIIVGISITKSDYIINYIFNNSLNLDIKQLDTDYGGTNYEENNNISTIAYNDTYWAWPTDNNFYLTSYYSNYHTAIDIVSSNRNIYSAYGGEIITNSYKFDNGNYLVLKQDNGYYTMYAHLSQKLVQKGQRVEKGQLIGIMGRTGYATGVHLHFSVWNGYPHQSKAINPLSFY